MHACAAAFVLLAGCAPKLCFVMKVSVFLTSCVIMLHCMQHPMPRRVHVRTSQDLKLDPERPEYHRATVHWRRYTPFNIKLRLA